MTILFDARRPVKSGRRFAAGLLASVPTELAPFPSFADAAWWAAESARLEDARLDGAAAEATALDTLTRGLIPADLAAAINASSLVGHPG